LAIFSASIGGIVIALPVVFVLGEIVGRRVLLLPNPEPWRCVSAGSAMFLFVVFFLLSAALFGVAGNALEGHNFVSYWLLKFVFVTLAAAAGMLISTVLEECVIARLSRKSLGSVSFYPAVWRANYLTLGFVLLAAALEMLPRRLHAAHFIVSWLHSFAGTLGFV
jgi:hypothetical protein